MQELERLLVIDKPAGLSSEDASRVVGARLVHRIDQATSGLLLLARDVRTVQRMQRALQQGLVTRRYVLVAHGIVEAGDRETTLVRDRGDGLRGTGAGGKAARLSLRVRRVGADERATLCDVELVTGRTHQIRIQLAEGGNPLVGERVYIRDHRAAGRHVLPAERLLLHAAELIFPDPSTHQRVTVAAEEPGDFRDGAARVLGPA